MMLNTSTSSECKSCRVCYQVGCQTVVSSPLIEGIRKAPHLPHEFNFTPIFKNKPALKEICVV